MTRKSSNALALAIGACCLLLLPGCMADDGVASSNGGTSDYDEYPGLERHSQNEIEGWISTSRDSLSTFGADVDEGSYTFARRKLLEGATLDPTAIRPEEFINYFAQDYPHPSSTFGVSLEAAPSLWRPESLHVLRVGIQGKFDSALVDAPWNLTFLIDVSGSMSTRMDFVKSILGVLVDNMRSKDVLSIAVYDATPRTLLEPVTLAQKDKTAIKAIISDLSANGSTNMAGGMRLGYQLNDQYRIPGGTNRVVVVSDGDANVGTTDADGILTLIKEHTDAGTTITTLGVGSGNFNAALMESLADRGNGNYYYLDSQREAERVLGMKLTSTMTLIARDLKIQVAFDPSRVSRYRLIGYENRAINDGDFTKDTTDGGEIGSGHRVTALYEMLLKTGTSPLGEVRLLYKAPNGTTDISLNTPIAASVVRASATDASARMRFTQCVAEFAERLRESPFAHTSYSNILSYARASHDPTDSADVELLKLIGLAGE